MGRIIETRATRHSKEQDVTKIVQNFTNINVLRYKMMRNIKKKIKCLKQLTAYKDKHFERILQIKMRYCKHFDGRPSVPNFFFYANRVLPLF